MVQKPIFTMTNNPGKIYTVMSTMFGGKSVYGLHLMETRSKLYSGVHLENKILYINHVNDNRSNQMYSTHSDIITQDALDKIKVDSVKCVKLSEIKDDIAKKYLLIVIDEAQFFDDLVENTLRFAEKLGIDVYALGLRTDYKRNKFGKISELADLADENIELRNTYCSICAKIGAMNKAIFNHRIRDNTHAQIEIGSDNYAAVCRKCYLENNV